MRWCAGAYTRQAYDGHVAEAIAQAAKRTEVASDWVLSDGNAQQPASPKDLQATLTAQYFADYAEQWQRFMNSLQWEPAPTLPAAIDQLKLMADARQSPVIALMKSLDYQGGAGARKDSLSDTLVAKAQDMLGKKATAPEVVKPDAAGPLGPTFGPIQRLMAVGEGAGGDMSLQRFLGSRHGPAPAPPAGQQQPGRRRPGAPDGAGAVPGQGLGVGRYPGVRATDCRKPRAPSGPGWGRRCSCAPSPRRPRPCSSRRRPA